MHNIFKLENRIQYKMHLFLIVLENDFPSQNSIYFCFVHFFDSYIVFFVYILKTYLLAVKIKYPKNNISWYLPKINHLTLI